MKNNVLSPRIMGQLCAGQKTASSKFTNIKMFMTMCSSCYRVVFSVNGRVRQQSPINRVQTRFLLCERDQLTHFHHLCAQVRCFYNKHNAQYLNGSFICAVEHTSHTRSVQRQCAMTARTRADQAYTHDSGWCVCWCCVCTTNNKSTTQTRRSLLRF